MAEVVFKAVTRQYDGAVAVDAFSLVAPDRQFTVLSGPPGSGKSVLLRLLVGLERPDEGSISIGGEDVTDAPPAARPIGYVPQSFALYPHLTVRENVGYPLRLAGAPKARISKQVERVASLLSIGHLLDKTPDTLSGGEKQRVAVARGLSRDARVFVLDDPLVGLDYKLRERLMSDLKALRAELDVTFLYAASDPLETLVMAQQLVVIEGGRLVQNGPVERVYDHPDHAASMRLVGFPRANLLPGRWTDDRVAAGPLRFSTSGSEAGRDVLVGIRPEAVGAPGRGVEGEGVVSLVEDLGGERVIYLDCADVTLTIVRPVDETRAPVLGERMRFSIAPREIIVFDAGSGAVLGRGAA